MCRKKPIEWFVDSRGCHVCTSHTRTPDGHVRCMRGGRFRGLHRIIYEQHKGPIPEGFVVRHTCDNPACINPEHLILGTHADNVRDRVERGRSAAGVANGRSKLSPEVVAMIRSTLESTRSLARRLGVTEKTIRLIRQGRRWKTVPPSH